MKKMLVILASALSFSAAFAQTPAPASPASASAAASGSKATHEERVEHQIGWLHSQLKITSAQEPQWNAFADVMRDNARTMGDLYRQRVAGSNQSALDDMKQYSAIADAHAQGTKKLVDAFAPLYDSLSPEQKKLADTTFHKSSYPGQPRHRSGKKKDAPQGQ